MNFEAIGMVHAYLLQHRIIETKPTGRRITPSERDIADCLLQFNYDDIEALDALFKAHGLKIKQIGFEDMPGIPRGGRVWMVLRDPSINLPDHISSSSNIRSISLKENESIECSSVWFLHIWLLCLAILYTNNGRSISEVSAYISSSLSKDGLVKAVREHIESLRSIGVDGGVHQYVYEALDSEKGKDIPRRVAAFLKTMESSRLIVETEKDEYQQTLLGAVEISENYNRSLAHIIPSDSILDNIVNIGTDKQLQPSMEEE